MCVYDLDTTLLRLADAGTDARPWHCCTTKSTARQAHGRVLPKRQTYTVHTTAGRLILTSLFVRVMAYALRQCFSAPLSAQM